MPLVGLGTWEYNDTVAGAAVESAFKLGYRHVDTALTYGNQRGVGQALHATGLARQEYFITSKIPGATTTDAKDTIAALEKCLSLLDTPYVDLMLIHWPGNVTKAGRQTQWRAMEQWARSGKARAIGVSHYCKSHVSEVLEINTVPIALNQNQFHVGMGTDTEKRLHDKRWLQQQGILFMAYSTLCGPCPAPDNHALITGELVTSVAKNVGGGVTGAQVALKWAVQQGIPVIPKSSNPKLQASNFDLFSFSIGDPDMVRLTGATAPAETGTTQNPDDAQDCAAE